MRHKHLKYSVIALGITAGLLCSGCSEDSLSGVDDSLISADFTTGNITGIQVSSHNIGSLSPSDSGPQYKTCDTVSFSYSADVLDGLLPQTVTKSAVYYLNDKTKTWELISEKTTGCSVTNEALKGSSWKLVSPSEDELKMLFGDEIKSGDQGEVYIRFLKSMGLFSFNPENLDNTSSERFFKTIGTNAKVTWVGQSGTVEKKFSISGGSVTDSGILNLDFETGTEADNISFGTEAVQISEQEYDIAVGAEAAGTKVYMDSLPVFNVSSASLSDGAWNTGIGLKEGNLSPELTWDPVEGASKYAVVMIDISTSNWLIWYVVADGSHLDEGTYTDPEIYAGPYPPMTHTYEIFIFALRSEPSDLTFKLDATGGTPDSYANYYNTAKDGSTGNVIAYGTLKGDYTSPELYYGYR